MNADVLTKVQRALEAREPDADVRSAVRLFAGAFEGAPGFGADLFGRSLVLRTPADVPEALARELVAACCRRLPRIRVALWRARDAEPAFLVGEASLLDREVREGGDRYAIALAELRDGGFYLDTAPLRAWLKASMGGARVLNAFAYTGSLGVAARLAPAKSVVHVDRSAAALDVAKRSYQLSGLPVRRADFRVRDFFTEAARMRRDSELFDCVILDPPFFADGSAGRVDLEKNAERLLDKARPLVADGGALVVVNNALWVSGAAWMEVLDRVCAGGYASFETRIGVPPEVRGLAPDGPPHLPSDPSPWEHPTKIAILRMRRKDGRR